MSQTKVQERLVVLESRLETRLNCKVRVMPDQILLYQYDDIQRKHIVDEQIPLTTYQDGTFSCESTNPKIKRQIHDVNRLPYQTTDDLYAWLDDDTNFMKLVAIYLKENKGKRLDLTFETIDKEYIAADVGSDEQFLRYINMLEKQCLGTDNVWQDIVQLFKTDIIKKSRDYLPKAIQKTPKDIVFDYDKFLVAVTATANRGLVMLEYANHIKNAKLTVDGLMRFVKNSETIGRQIRNTVFPLSKNGKRLINAKCVQYATDALYDDHLNYLRIKGLLV